MSLPFFSVPSVLSLVTRRRLKMTKTEARHPRNEKRPLSEFTNNNEMTRVGAQGINKHKIPHDSILCPDPSFLSLGLLSVFFFWLSCISNSAWRPILCERRETTRGRKKKE